VRTQTFQTSRSCTRTVPASKIPTSENIKGIARAGLVHRHTLQALLKHEEKKQALRTVMGVHRHVKLAGQYTTVSKLLGRTVH
jgi:hypothetical protein